MTSTKILAPMMDGWTRLTPKDTTTNRPSTLVFYREFGDPTFQHKLIAVAPDGTAAPLLPDGSQVYTTGELAAIPLVAQLRIAARLFADDMSGGAIEDMEPIIGRNNVSTLLRARTRLLETLAALEATP